MSQDVCSEQGQQKLVLSLLLERNSSEVRQMETLHSHKVKSEILWNFKQLIDISPVMAGSQRKPACLICPSSWDINPPLMGIYRQDKYPLLGGFSSSISFGPTASCLSFLGMPGIQQSHARKGVDWKEDGLQTGLALES